MRLFPFCVFSHIIYIHTLWHIKKHQELEKEPQTERKQELLYI